MSLLTLFLILTFFDTLTKNDASNRLNNIIIVIIGSISIEIDTSLAFFQKLFLSDILIFFSKTWSAILAEVTNRSRRFK